MHRISCRGINKKLYVLLHIEKIWCRWISKKHFFRFHDFRIKITSNNMCSDDLERNTFNINLSWNGKKKITHVLLHNRKKLSLISYLIVVAEVMSLLLSIMYFVKSALSYFWNKIGRNLLHEQEFYSFSIFFLDGTKQRKKASLS